MPIVPRFLLPASPLQRPLGARSGRSVDVGILVVLCLSMGSLYPVTSIALRGYNALSLVLCRLAVGTTFLAGWAAFRRVGLPREPRMLALLASVGAANTLCAYLLITWGQGYVTSSMAAILGGTGPIFTAAWATLMLPDERLTASRALGVGVGFAGVFLLLWRQVSWRDVTGGSGELFGTAAILLGAAGIAGIATVVRTHLRALSPVQIALPMVVSGLLVLAPVAAMLSVTHVVALRADPSDAGATAAAIGLGLVNAGFGPLLYYAAILRWGATRSALTGYAVPLIGVGIGAFALHERVPIEMAVCLLLVTLSFIWVGPPVSQDAVDTTYPSPAIGKERS